MPHPEKLTAGWEESWEKLLAVNLPFKIFLKGRDLTYLACNESYAANHGMKTGEILGRSDFNLYPRELAEKYRAEDLRILETGLSETIEGRYVKDGQEHHGQTIKSLFRDQSGEVIGILGTFWDISELKRAERALQKSEEKYRALVENANEAIIVIQDGALKFANPKASKLLGYSLEEGIGRPFVEFIHPDDRLLVAERYQKRLSGEVSTVVYPLRTIHKDGSIRWAEINSVLISWEDKPAIMSYLSDITERKRAEEALQNERSLLRTLIDNIPDSIYSKDLACRKTLANLTELHYLGAKSESEVVGKDDFEFYPKELAEGYFADDQSVMQSGQPVLNKEELVINENGHQRWLLTSKLPLKDESGNITGIVGIGRDITERKQAEEALQQSHERFQLANLATFNAIWDWNLQTDALWWNENFQALFGYRAEEIEPGIESWTNRIHPEDVDRIKTGIHSAIDSGQQSWSGHYRFRRKDGSYAEVEDRGYISREANGKPVRMIGAMQDITERKQAEEALRESESSLQAILRSTADGFLAVDRENRVLLANGRFEEMWKIPQEVMTSKDDSVLLQYILDQLIDPQGFLQKVQQLYKSDEDSFDTLFFKDGRIFERLSRPLMAGTELRGRVWSFRDITERKRAEDALRESEQRFDDIIDFLPDATFAINLKGEVIAWNRALEELTGAAKEELIGKGAFAYAVPFYGKTGPMLIDLIFQDREEMKKNYDYLIKRRDQVVAEAFVPALRGGKGAYLWGIASPLYDSSGAIVGAIESLRDITERKRAEGEQRTAEANYRNLFERVPSGLYRSTPEGRFLEVNQAMVDLFGYSSVQEMMTLDIGSAFYHSAEERDQWVKKLLQTGELRNTENHSLRKDGNSMVLLENSRVVRDESGKVLFFEGTLTDTTDRKRAEEASRKSEEKYRLLIENSHDIIYTLTPDGVFTFVSPGWTALLGHPVIEVVGKPFQKFVHPDDLERCRVFLQKTIETGQRQMGIEYRTQHADGSWRWHTSNGVPLKDETGKVVSYEGIASDITERKQIEGEMEKTRANFLFGVSHELKTPLFLMDISLEMLENSPESGRAKRTSEFMETWKRNLHRLRHLVFNMVDSQRTQTMGFKIERQSTDFRALIERVVQEHELLAGPKKIRITMDLAPIPPMFIDPEAIHRLVENLLTNAIKFSPRSGEVTIRLVEEDAKAVLTVKDQGSGISAEEQKGLFLPFQRAATAVRSVIPGTGLGLYVAKIIVDAHGGTISLRSKVGKGTTVTARLPLGELGK